MSWLERIGIASSPASLPEQEEGDAGSLERRSPGLGALFGSLREDGHHSILDLGPAEGRRLGLLAGFARQIRFAGLLPGGEVDADWLAAVRALPPNEAMPYDVVLVWDLLNRLEHTERAAAMARIAELTAPGACLYALVDGAGATMTRPLAFELLDLGRVAERPVRPAEPARSPLLPAQVERALAPFEVVRAFVLRTGMREYFAVKRDGPGRGERPR